MKKKTLKEKETFSSSRLIKIKKFDNAWVGKDVANRVYF